ncbi:transposase [Syntrophus aciditrophicus SB]|uniref:Mutator family transposase n=2 Tax=Syntrophus TaxID=43773 RepID=Q2LXF4_SYNAS|nr:transposase [Syntrophus aciditrophicus SB]
MFEMMRLDVRGSVGKYLSRMMDAELCHLLKREYYEYGKGEVNHRNGHYSRHFTLKRIGKVDVEVPQNRWGDFRSQVLPKSKRYEEEPASSWREFFKDLKSRGMDRRKVELGIMDGLPVFKKLVQENFTQNS